MEESPYVYRDRLFEIIEHFVCCCEENGLKVVLNMHKCLGNYCDIKEEFTIFQSEELQKRFIALWLEFEKRFAHHPDVMFELLNEVRDVDPDDWNKLAIRTVAALREINTERKIIVGPISWNDAKDLDSLHVFDDENVIYTFHMYYPHEFTHQQSVLHANVLYYNRKMSYPSTDMERYRDYRRLVEKETNPYAEYTAIDKEFLRQKLAGAIRFIEKHPDKILWAGEFGTIRHADIKSRENWMRDVISILVENDIPYSVWNYLSTPNDGNRFSLVDDDTRQILSPNLLEIIRGNV